MALKIPGYVLKREVGSGGMASVYLAVQKSLDRRVALKVMSAALAADQSFTKRFLREAKTVAALSHPNIVSIYDIGVVSGSQLHYFSMQYLPNGDFSTRIRNGVSEEALITVLTSMARALGYAHELGFVHRDVKPGNILFDQTDTPILTDFGIARAANNSTRMTGTGVSVGTSHYMSPEQARGKDVDARSDLYSLGAMAFEALAGRPPYDGEDGFAIAYCHVFDPIPSLPPAVSHWQPFIDKALAKSPDDRFQSADEIIAALQSRTGDSKLILSSASQRAVEHTTPLPTVTNTGTRRPPFDLRRSVETLFRAMKGAPGHWRYGLLDRVERVVDAAIAGFSGACDRVLPFVPARWRAISALVGLMALVAVAAIWLGSRAPSMPSTSGELAAVAVPEGEDAAPSPEIADGPDDVMVETSPPLLSSGFEPDSGTESDDVRAEEDDRGQALTEENDASAAPPGQITTQPAIVASPSLAEMGALLADAQRDLEENRLMVPAGNNAFDRLVRVLAADPQNATALSGMARIVDRYLTLAGEQGAERDFRQASTFLQRAQSAAEVANSVELRERLRAARQRLRDSAVHAAETAVEAGNVTQAARLYRDGLLFAPNDAQLTDALAALEDSVDAVGRFTDQLSDGSAGPRMVMVDFGPYTLEVEGESLAIGAKRRIAVTESEVTVAQFRRFLEATGYFEANRASACRENESRWRSSRDRTWDNPGFPVNDDHPVTCIDWDAASAYAAWLASETGFSYRLPSESEWEYLAHRSQPEGSICAQENVADLWFKQVDADGTTYDCEDGWTYTAPVDSLGVNAIALSGVIGNVREWTADCWTDERAEGSQTFAPKLNGDCDTRVVKGISWMHGEGADELAQRVGFDRDNAYNTVGFRLVRTVQ